MIANRKKKTAKAKRSYRSSRVEEAHRWLVKAYDTLAEARSLAKSGETRLGAYNRLYYAAHHAAVALLRLVGDTSRKHTSIINNFGNKWVRARKFPKTYGRLLKQLHEERSKADYGEYVPTLKKSVDKRLRSVELFLQKSAKTIPAISFAHIIQLIAEKSPEMRDISFDVYCPKSYYHHTRFTMWCPKGRLTDKWMKTALNGMRKTLVALHIKEAKDYVIGFNSRVNQYKEEHLIMLDFDNVSTFPTHLLKGEPGFVFRTHSGFHFIGLRLYKKSDWSKRMKRYAKIASKQHYELSMKRGYATLRLTASPRKPHPPIYAGRIN